MKKTTLLLIVFAIICAMPAICCAAVGPNWIEQWGITWTFDKNISTDGSGNTYQYGTFVNGDYWVVGPVKIIYINPPSITGLDTVNPTRIKNGSMLNPVNTSKPSIFINGN
jgi:hypothetical protein